MTMIYDILSFGYWYNKNQAAGDDFVPLYTRFQPQNCREPAEQKSDRCKEPMDIARFEPYAFQRSARSFNRSLQEILGGKQERICVEGASHSRKLCQSIAKLLDEANNEIMTSNLTYHNVTLASSSFTIQFAEDYEHKIPDFLQKNCTKIIFGVGQWDLGWPRRHPTPFRQYEERLKQSMTVMIQQLRNERNIDLYLRSTHYNPLGDSISKCPPADWRNPPAIDMYNTISKRLCNELNVTFLDSKQIMDVMWDSAGDWCHYTGIVAETEALYFLHRILS